MMRRSPVSARSWVARNVALIVWFGLLTVAIVLVTSLEPTRISVPMTSFASAIDWGARVSPDKMAVELIKIITLAVAAWLATTSALVLVVRLTSPRSLAKASRLLPRIARPIFRPVVAAALSSSLLLGTAGFANATEAGREQPDAPVLIHLGTAGPSSPTAPDGDDESPPTTGTEAELPELVHFGPSAGLRRIHHVLASPIHGQPPVASAATTTQWIVESGDHFWSIASAVVTASSDTTPSASTIGEYWLRLIEANRDELPDPSNPDLIYPGMTLATPTL